MRTEWTICITIYNEQDEAINTETFTCWTDTKHSATSIGIEQARIVAKNIPNADYWDVDVT